MDMPQGHEAGNAPAAVTDGAAPQQTRWTRRTQLRPW